MLTVNMLPGFTSYIGTTGLIYDFLLIDSSLYVSSLRRASLMLPTTQYVAFYDTRLLSGSVLYFHSVPSLRVHIKAILF